MTSARILLLEDDPNLGFILKEHLELQGYAVDLSTNGVDGMECFRRGGYALCLVDVMMPKKDGFTFAREVRVLDDQIPLMFLTARSLKEDRVEGLKIGADDYITKPFSMEELMLRIRAVLKRTRPAPAVASARGEYTIGSFTFDADTRLLRGPDTSEELTTRETDLLKMFCEQDQRVLERTTALRQIWGTDSFFAGRSMDVFISRLRKRLAGDPGVQIVNVHGKGFRLIIAQEQTGPRTAPSKKPKSTHSLKNRPTPHRKRG
jgi:two-component system, OmpR family, response regulator VicR